MNTYVNYYLGFTSNNSAAAAFSPNIHLSPSIRKLNPFKELGVETFKIIMVSEPYLGKNYGDQA